jgi:hypothetical protein
MKHSIVYAGLALALSLTACSEEAPLGELEQPANTGPVGFSDFADLSQTQIVAAIDPAFGFGPIQNAAKDMCGERTQCDVLLFAEGTTLPTSLPYTARETDSALGRYLLDRELNVDEMRVNCPRIPRTPDENCIAG